MIHDVQPLGLDDTSHFTRTQHLRSCPHKHLQHTVTTHTQTAGYLLDDEGWISTDSLVSHLEASAFIHTVCIFIQCQVETHS